MHAATTFWRCAPRASLTCHHHGFWQGHGPAGPFWGGPADGSDGWGNFPRYPQFLIDYVHFNKGLSTSK